MTDVGTTKRSLSTRDKLRIWERDKGICQECQRQLNVGDRWTCEHVRALELGGTNDDANLAVYCNPCALEKTRGDHSSAAKAKRNKARHVNARKAPSVTIQSAGFSPVDKSTKASRLRPASKHEGMGLSNLFRRFM